MEVNVTLVLQTLQFLCVYSFLYRCLFIPACKLLDERERFEHYLQADLKEHKQEQQVLQQEYRAWSQQAKDELIQQIPEQATKSEYKKSDLGSTLYELQKVEFLEQDLQKTEEFLVDHFSRIVKK